LPDALAASSLLMVFMGLLAFFTLLYVPAPYGRYQSVSGAFYSLGLPDLPGPAAWLLQECPAFFCFLYQVGASSAPAARALTPNAVLLAAFAAHYFNRSFVYPLRLVGGKTTPAGVFLMALAFCVWNGTAQGAYLARAAQWGGAAEALLAPRFVGGVLLGALGALVNLEADAILRGLRKPGDKGYYIPRVGGLPAAPRARAPAPADSHHHHHHHHQTTATTTTTRRAAPLSWSAAPTFLGRSWSGRGLPLPRTRRYRASAPRLRRCSSCPWRACCCTPPLRLPCSPFVTSRPAAHSTTPTTRSALAPRTPRTATR
jgi:hypothetical protein